MVSMLMYATRSPLALVTNAHYAMSERRSSRRISARLSEKENDAPEANGIEASRKAASGAANSTGKAGNADANGGKGAMKGKRKQGGSISHLELGRFVKAAASLGALRIRDS